MKVFFIKKARVGLLRSLKHVKRAEIAPLTAARPQVIKVCCLEVNSYHNGLPVNYGFSTLT